MDIDGAYLFGGASLVVPMALGLALNVLLPYLLDLKIKIMN
jgi:hypothetical protein